MNWIIAAVLLFVTLYFIFFDSWKVLLRSAPTPDGVPLVERRRVSIRPRPCPCQCGFFEVWVDNAEGPRRARTFISQSDVLAMRGRDALNLRRRRA